MITLAKNLALSIRLEQSDNGDVILIELEEPLAMLQTECRYELSKATHYHLREAIIIAMRRLMNQAITEGLIAGVTAGLTQVTRSPSFPGALTKLNAQAPPAGPRGIEVDITFSTDEELW